MKYNVSAACPHCEEPLILDEQENMEFFEDNIYLYMHGHCDTCGRLYDWTEIYSYDGYDDLTEVEGEG